MLEPAAQVRVQVWVRLAALAALLQLPLAPLRVQAAVAGAAPAAWGPAPHQAQQQRQGQQQLGPHLAPSPPLAAASQGLHQLPPPLCMGRIPLRAPLRTGRQAQ